MSRFLCSSRLTSTVLALLLSGCDGIGGWTPDPDQCFEDQLEAESPKVIRTEDGIVMSCRSRWLPEHHCYGTPPPPEDRFPLEWAPWAITYGYINNEYQQSIEVNDHEFPPNGLLGPHGECLFDQNTFYAETDRPSEYAGWTADVGECTAETLRRCRCNDDLEPDDPTCLDVEIP